MIEIEKGIEIPPRGISKGRPRKYPFTDMEVGDSFFAAAEGEDAKKRAQSSISAAVRASRPRRTNGYKFVTRRVDGGVRCWRIA